MKNAPFWAVSYHFDEATCKKIRHEIMPQINALLEKHGLELKIKNMYYSPDKVTLPKAMFIKKGAAFFAETSSRIPKPANTADTLAENFKLYAMMYGMDPDWLGKKVKIDGCYYTIAGLDPSKPKNCVKLLSTRGNPYVGKAATVINAANKGFYD